MPIILLLCAVVCLSTSPLAWSQADTTREPVRAAYQPRMISKAFRIPRNLQHEVMFWKNIYSVYDRNQVVIHDPNHLERVYEVVDLSDIHPLGDPYEAMPKDVRVRRQARVDAVKAKVQQSLLAIADNQSSRGLSRFDRKIRKVLPHNMSAEELKEAADIKRIRGQTGLRDKFHAAIARSGRYLDRVEAIFAEENVPWEITRLAFVESMFDLRAYSKVGASGVWQFMPATAKIMGLTVNDLLDERNDPIAATRAAAKLLMKNYRYLDEHWLLAINAYNAGPGRLKQAVKAVGTHDVGKIIHNFEHRAYGFASRNFVPTFLAALHTFEERANFFGDVAIDAPLQYDTLVTNYALRLPQLAQRTGISLDDLWELNPGYAAEVYDGSMDLPAGHAINVPYRESKRYLAAIKQVRLPVATAE